MRRLVALVAFAASLACPAIAPADMQVLGGPSRMVCGDGLELGVREKPGTVTGGIAQVSVFDARTGRRWWHRAASGTERWRTWFLPSGHLGRCGPTTVVYRVRNGDGSTWSLRRTVRFRSEGV